MQPDRLARLERKLREAGIAERHVRRLVREVRDHHDDIAREISNSGLTAESAEAAIWARVGSLDALAASAASRQELRAFSARHPALAYLWGAIALWTLFVAAGVATDLIAGPSGIDAFWAEMQWTFILRALPLVFGIVVLVRTVRRGRPVAWPLIGWAVMAALAGTSTYEVRSAPDGYPVSVSVSQWLLPVFSAPFTDRLGPVVPLEVLAGIARAALFFMLVAGPLLAWRRARARALTGG